MTHQKKRTKRGTNKLTSKNQIPISCVSICVCNSVYAHSLPEVGMVVKSLFEESGGE